MTDYLTRVVLAGARTGNGVVRPVRVTAALPPTVASAATMGSALAVAEPLSFAEGEKGLRAEGGGLRGFAESAVEPEVPMRPREEEPELTPEVPARGDTPVAATPEPLTVARLFEPHPAGHVVRMPRGIRAAEPPPGAQPAPSERGAEGAPAPRSAPPSREASILAAHEALVNATTPVDETTDVSVTPGPSPRAMAESVPVPRVQAQSPRPAIRSVQGAGREIAIAESIAVPVTQAEAFVPVPASIPVPASVAVEAQPSRSSPASATRPQPVAPRIGAANASSDTGPPRRRVTIGRLELQVQHVAPPQAPAIVRPPRVPAPPADALEGQFLDGLRWKL